MFLDTLYDLYKNTINESLVGRIKQTNDIDVSKNFPWMMSYPFIIRFCEEFEIPFDEMERCIENNGEKFINDERFWAVQDMTGVSPINIVNNDDKNYGQPTYKVFYPNDKNNPYKVFSVWTEDEEENWFENNGSEVEEEIYYSSKGCSGQQVFLAINKGYLNCVTLEDVFPFDLDEDECIDEFVDAEYKSVEEFIEDNNLEFDYEVNEYADIDWEDVPQSIIDKVCQEVQEHWFGELCQYSEPDWDAIADAVWNQDGILGFISTYDGKQYEGTAPEELGEETFNIYRHE